MQFDTTNKSTRAYNPNSDNNAEDIGFIQAIGVNFKKNILTDLDFSENIQYNDAAVKYGGDEAKIGLSLDSIPLTKERVQELDTLMSTNDITFNKDGEQTAGTPSANAKLWYNMKKKGFTPETFYQKVVEDTAKQARTYQKELINYDEDNMWGASGLSAFIGGTASWLVESTNVGGLGAEVKAFKHLGKSFLKENKSFLQGVSKDFKFLNFIKKRGAITPKDLKVFTKLTKRYGLDNLQGIERLAEKGIKKGQSLEDISKRLLKEAKAGKHDDLINQTIIKLNRNSRLNEVMVYGATSGGIGGITEAIHQLNTFDFKHDVLGEQYDMGDAVIDISMGTGFGFAGAAGFNVLNNFLYNKSLIARPREFSEVRPTYSEIDKRIMANDDFASGKPPIREGAEHTVSMDGDVMHVNIDAVEAGIEEITAENIMKASADVAENKIIDVDGSTALGTDGIDSVSINNISEDIDKIVTETEQNVGFQPTVEAHKKEMDQFERVKECMMIQENIINKQIPN